MARQRYPADRKAILRTALKRDSESEWNRRLARLATDGDTYDGVYSTALYRSGKAAAPLLIGSYDTLADYLGRYVDAGVRTLLVAQVESEEDHRHVQRVLGQLRRPGD